MPRTARWLLGGLALELGWALCGSLCLGIGPDAGRLRVHAWLAGLACIALGIAWPILAADIAVMPFRPRLR